MDTSVSQTRPIQLLYESPCVILKPIHTGLTCEACGYILPNSMTDNEANPMQLTHSMVSLLMVACF